MKETMEAFAAFGPGDLRRVTLPVPEPDDYEVLVEPGSKVENLALGDRVICSNAVVKGLVKMK